MTLTTRDKLLTCAEARFFIQDEERWSEADDVKAG